jgi:membrane-bound inhibitor of C-type lysozyme
MRAFLAASALLALAACNKPAATPPRPPPPPPVSPAVVAPELGPEAAPVNPPVTIATYACTGGNILEAGYPNATNALLIWQGRAYNLTQAPAASGARYTGGGLQWWTRGPTHGTLAILKTGEEIATDPGLECVAGEAAAATTTAAPGTPGALPDDKTPIAETPIAPTSAQAAANVVQTYYALLEKRSSVDAAQYRADGTPENLSQYSSLHAQVGAPGTIQKAGRAFTVEVPVVLSGRTADGAAFSRSGKLVLRRLGDVAGSTPAQREWRIERFNLK